MDICSSAPKFLFLSLIVCSTGVSFSHVKYIKHQREATEDQISLKFQLPKTVEHDFLNFPATTTPATVTVPPDTSTPAIITVPSSTPVPITPTPPSTPVTTPPTTPATNPVTTPTPNNPGVTNPVTTPVVAPAPPAATTNAPGGQSWCVAKSGVPEKSLQSALDYACGIGKADCSGIQQGASCYNPNTLQNHASVAFNSYYQKNPVPTSCDFGSTAMITTANPSSGSCIFTSSSSSSSPTTTSPITTPPANPATTPPTNPATTPPTNPASTPPTNPASTPATPTPVPTTSSSTGAAPTGSSGAPPGLLNGSFPGFGGDSTGFGQGPSAANITSSVSRTSNLQHFIRSILVVTFIAGVIVLDI